MAIIILSIINLITVSLIRKNEFEGIMNHVYKCSGTDLFLWFVFLLIWGLLLFWSVRVLKKEHKLKERVKYQFVKGDIEWTPPIIVKMLIIAIIGGMLSSYVGLGGGIIFGPVMLEFGVHPRVSSSTSMYMVMLSTLVAVVQYFFMGVLPLDYSLGFSITIIIFTIIGHMTLNTFLNKHGKPSFFALFLAAVIILWAIMILIFSIIEVTHKITSGENMFAFKQYWG